MIIIAVSMRCELRSPLAPDPGSPWTFSRPADGWGRGPALEISRSVVIDPTQLSFVDQIAGESNRGYPTIVKPDHVGNGLRGVGHRFSLADVIGERLFAQYHLARFGCGDCHLRMDVVGRADVDDVDIVTFDNASPVGFNFFPIPRLGQRFGRFAIAPADDLATDFGQLGKEVADLGVGVA